MHNYVHKHSQVTVTNQKEHPYVQNYNIKYHSYILYSYYNPYMYFD